VGGPGDIGTDRRVAWTSRASDLEDIGFLGRRGEGPGLLADASRAGHWRAGSF